MLSLCKDNINFILFIILQFFLKTFHGIESHSCIHIFTHFFKDASREALNGQLRLFSIFLAHINILLFIDKGDVVANAFESRLHLSEVHHVLPIVGVAAVHLFSLLDGVVKVEQVIKAEIRTLEDNFLRVDLLALERVPEVPLHKSVE